MLSAVLGICWTVWGFCEMNIHRRGVWGSLSTICQLPACKSRCLVAPLHLATHCLPGDAGATLLVCLPSQGRLMNHCFSCRVTCLCAQFEAVLQHGLKRSRGLALTAAAIKQAAGFSSKTETGTIQPDAARRALSFFLLSLYVFVVSRAVTVRGCWCRKPCGRMSMCQ